MLVSRRLATGLGCGTVGCGGAAPVGVPHSMQKRDPATRGAPHEAHAVAVWGCPQCRQNFAPSGSSWAQLTHAVILASPVTAGASGAPGLGLAEARAERREKRAR